MSRFSSCHVFPHCCVKLSGVFLERGKGIRFLSAILVIAALIPGATVLCLSSGGHVAFESQLTCCCTVLPVPFQNEGAAVLDLGNKGCKGCRDVPVLAVTESRVRPVSIGDDHPLFAFVEPEALPNSPGSFEQMLSADSFHSLTHPPSTTPLRC